MAVKSRNIRASREGFSAGLNSDFVGDVLILSLEPALQAARDFYLRLAVNTGGPVLVLKPEGRLFADELARVLPRIARAHRAEGGFRLAVAPLGALEPVASHRERCQLLDEVFKLLAPKGVFSLDLQMVPARRWADGVSRFIAERRDDISRNFFWENRRFEAASNRLERRFAVKGLTGDGTVRKTRYRSVVLCLVEPESFRRDALVVLALYAGVAHSGLWGRCERVVDGYTVWVTGIGKVRLIGVDTLELGFIGNRKGSGEGQINR